MESKSAKALKENALVILKEALQKSETPEDFLSSADEILKNPNNLLELPINLGDPDFPLSPGTSNDSGRDVENASLVYEYLGALDRANAADRRLWTYLAFVTYRDYMETRWSLLEVRNWKTRVKNRWLLSNATRGKLVRHGIARLWWVTSLTFDPKRKHKLSLNSDQFAYTREVFKNEDRINSIFDRELGAVPAVVRSVIEYAAQGGMNGTDDQIRALMKELTLAYGYRDLGILDEASLQELIIDSVPLPKPDIAFE